MINMLVMSSYNLHKHPIQELFHSYWKHLSWISVILNDYIIEYNQNYLPTSKNTESVYGRKRPCMFRISLYTVIYDRACLTWIWNDPLQINRTHFFHDILFIIVFEELHIECTSQDIENILKLVVQKTKTDEVDNYVYDLFQRARENFWTVHDMDLRCWARKKPMN